MRKRLVLVALLAAVTLMLGLVGFSSGDAAGGKAQEDVEGLPGWADEAAVTEQARDAIAVSYTHLNQYRICFRWTSAGAEDVEIADYH